MSILIESCNDFMIGNMNESISVLNLNEGIGDMLKSIWTKIKEFFKKIWNWIKEKVNKFIDLFKKNKKVKEKEVKELENKIKMTEQQAKSAPLMLEYNGTNEKIADVVQKENREVVAKEIKEKFPNKDIWLWTGYTLNQILKIDETLLENIDILVDGRYECDLPHTKRYRGSDNQLRYKINKREYILLD